MPTIITGAIGEADIYSVATQKRDVGLMVSLLDPKSAPLVLLTQTGMDARNFTDVAKAKLKKAESVDPKFEWIEDQLEPQVSAINNVAGYTSSNTSIVVDEGDYFPDNCYIFVKRTGEIMTRTEESSDTLTVTRASLGTTSQALNDNDELIILDPANEEGAALPTARSTLKSLAYNYCEIVRTVLNMTNTIMNTAMLGEDRDWEFQKKKQAIAHALKLERKFIYGGRSLVRTGTETMRTMGGLATTITTNAYDAGGTLTEKNFNQLFLEQVFTNGRGSSYRILLASQRLNSVISGWGGDKLKTDVGKGKFGFVINEYISPHGTIYLIPHHLLSGTQGVTGICIDPEKIKYRYLQNRDTKFLDDVVKDGSDGRKGEYISEVGIEIRNEQVHGLLKNVEA